MIAAASVALALLPALTGAGLARRLLPRPRSAAEVALAIATSFVVGVGVHACALFLWLGAGGRRPTALVALDAALVAAALVLGRRRAVDPAVPDRPRVVAGRHERLALWILAGGAVATAGYAIGAMRWQPWGGWDAWAIYDLRARFLARAPGAWDLFRAAELRWSLPDYPLLLPSAVARVWLVLGESDAAPVALAVGFTISGALAAFGLTGAVGRSGPVPAIAALAVLASPAYLAQGVARVADVPVAALVAASLALLAVALRDRTRGPALLAGLAAALAAWTKNDGVLALAAIGASLALLERRALPAFVGGAAPVVAVIVAFKLLVAPQSYLVAENTWPALAARLLDPARYLLVVRHYLGAFLANAAVPLVPVAALAAAGLRPARPAAWAVLALALVVAGDFAVYVATPMSLAWQLDTSAVRVALQLWPALCGVALGGARLPAGAAAHPGETSDGDVRTAARPAGAVAGRDAEG